MTKKAQLYSRPMANEPMDTPMVDSQQEQEETELKEQELRMLNQQLRLIQNKIQMLQSQAQVQDLADENQESLERLEQKDEQDSDQQKNLNVQNKMLQQQQQVNQQMNQQQQQMMQQMASRQNWVHPEFADARIVIKNTEVFCDVAVTPKQQASGLQPYSKLDENRGLWFPMATNRMAAFHMGEVKFPIDIIFVRNNEVKKIAHNVKPRQSGAFTHVCSDVIEVNGGWCESYNIKKGDRVITPLNNKEGQRSYDLLRTITQADNETSDLEKELLELFPHLKNAQEHRLPDTTTKRFDTKDNRDPTVRFEHDTLPDEFSPFGDGDGADVDPFGGHNVGDGSSYGKHFKLQEGYDPVIFREEDHDVAIRPAASKNLNTQKLIASSLTLYDKFTPEFHEDETSDYDKIAVLSDQAISSWIDSLGFEKTDEEKLRTVMFTDKYKTMLGDALVGSGKITNYDLFDSDLLLFT